MHLNEWLIMLIVFVILIIIYQLGFFYGKKNKPNRGEGHSTRIANIQAGLMGLLGVMLAFSFSLSSQRFEQRRQLVIQESTNIGMCYFRAGLLPDTLRNDIRDMLKLYLDERINFFKPGNTSEDMEKTQLRSESLQIQIWKKTADLGRREPNLNTNVNILSLNSMIDISSIVSSNFQSRVPLFILSLLTFIAFGTILIIGYSHGLSLDKNFPFMILLISVLCSILALIIDLDTPATGFLQADIYSLLKLKAEILKYDR